MGWSEVGLSSFETSMEFAMNLSGFRGLWGSESEKAGNLGRRVKWVLDFGGEGWENGVEMWKEKVGLVVAEAMNGGAMKLFFLSFFFFFIYFK